MYVAICICLSMKATEGLVNVHTVYTKACMAVFSTLSRDRYMY